MEVEVHQSLSTLRYHCQEHVSSRSGSETVRNAVKLYSKDATSSNVERLKESYSCHLSCCATSHFVNETRQRQQLELQVDPGGTSYCIF